MIAANITSLWQTPGGVDAGILRAFVPGSLFQARIELKPAVQMRLEQAGTYKPAQPPYACAGLFVHGKHLTAAGLSLF